MLDDPDALAHVHGPERNALIDLAGVEELRREAVRRVGREGSAAVEAELEALLTARDAAAGGEKDSGK